MPEQLPGIEDQLVAAGMKVSPRTLTNLHEAPMAAIVSLGGCSASFVSPQGLLLTNHHCAYGSIQFNSTADRNLLRDGFLARSRQEELPASPSIRVLVTIDTRDVTDRVMDGRVRSLSGARRLQAIEANRSTLENECERHTAHRCTVSSFHEGVQFRLTEQLEIRDVRLVYAPPESVGKFGGNTDNFAWPRHTGDFAFLRAYVSPTGAPADKHADNIPYVPRHHLRLSNRGPRPGDFVMAVGYPASTHRYRLPAQVQTAFEVNYPEQLRLLQEQLAIVQRQTAGRSDAELAYAGIMASLNNRLKKTQGLLAAYSGSDVLRRGEERLQGLNGWISESAARQQQYGRSLVEVVAISTELDRVERDEQRIKLATPRLLEAAKLLYRYAREKSKRDDLSRKSGFQQRDWPRIRAWLEAMDKRYDERVDQALAAHFLKAQLDLPVRERDRQLLAALGIRDGMTTLEVERVLQRLHENSRLHMAAQRLSWLEQGVAKFHASNDAFIRAARSLYEDDLRRERHKQALEGQLQQASSNYMQALLAYQESRGERVYPDANGTLRISVGKVDGRQDGGKDGLAWAPFTTLRGLMAKNRGEGEFALPRSQIDAIRSARWGSYYDAGLGSVPVNYLATLDLTGGNSGSAILDARGELIGLAFDASLDSVISDWAFDAARTRSIAVDLRYILWQLDVVDRAHELLKELAG